MSVQVLVATMNQKDHSLLETMNIQSDAIVGNQCDHNSVEDFFYNGHKIRYLNFAECGVGLNRNNALMRADADICLFADDDLVYVDGYVDIVEKAFQQFPDADVIAFNFEDHTDYGDKQPRYTITKASRVYWHNYLRYGTARIAIRLESIRKHGILFNLCYGGGTEHNHGEDNLFLTSCLKNGLKIYAVPQVIADLMDDRASTWDGGYDDKYLKDQGALYYEISRHWWKLLCAQDAIRHHGEYHKSAWDAYKTMIHHNVAAANRTSR